MRKTALAVAIGLLLTGLSAANEGKAAMVRQATDIPPQDLAPALRLLAKERNFQLVIASRDISGLHTEGAIGEYTAEEALGRLLVGTGFTYRYLNAETVTVVKLGSAKVEDQPVAKPDAQEVGKASSQGFRVAQVDQADARAQIGQEKSEQKLPADGLNEIVVTAQKRSELLQDVPIPMAVIDPNSLVESNQLRFQDYASSVPGLIVTPARSQYQTLSIRGISTGSLTNPTVGIVIDDVPYGSSTDLGGAAGLPDIDPSDLARIEVLRGPQGALYGASSMGGLIKFVTADPSSDAISGRVAANLEGVYGGAEPGYGVRGAVNLPVTDTIATRLSAFARQDAGYVDDPALHRNGVNEDHAEGGHFAGLWKPSADLSVKVSALVQETDSDGHADADPSLGGLRQDYIPGAGKNSLSVQSYSANINARLGSAELVSVTGYNVNAITDTVDYSSTFFGGPVLSTYHVPGVMLTFNNRTKKLSQELRLTMPLGPYVDWLVGGFYTHERSTYFENLLAENPTSGKIVADGYYLSFPTTFAEYAGFSDLTWHVTSRFDVQVGARESHIEQSKTQTVLAPLFGGTTPSFTPEADANANAFTYLLTPRFKISQDKMVYARVASGYRAGGTNPSPIHPEYGPDKTENYELGFKGEFLEHTLSIDASIFRINWHGLQITLLDPQSFSYAENGNGAKSQGVEVSLQSRPNKMLTLSSWVSYADTELTSNLPPPPASTAYGLAGDRLPLSAKISGSASADFHRTLWADNEAFAILTESYVGDRLGNFQSNAVTPRDDLPGYAKMDLRVGFRSSSWMADVYANNLCDRRGALAGGDIAPVFAKIYLQPRTVGVSVSKTF